LIAVSFSSTEEFLAPISVYAMNNDARDWRRVKLTTDEMMTGFKKLAEIRFLTEETGQTMVQAALRFFLDAEGVSSVIPGAKNRQQLIDNAGAAGVPGLGAEERSRTISIAEASGIEF
jgi:aryl-alcohol dehydrogenase-like predicted oxidoreductase